ncbi:hypothetical protein CsSME_00008701 [Camellia sinensis var. sinensis]
MTSNSVFWAIGIRLVVFSLLGEPRIAGAAAEVVEPRVAGAATDVAGAAVNIAGAAADVICLSRFTRMIR